jgi:hypothetical protein
MRMKERERKKKRKRERESKREEERERITKKKKESEGVTYNMLTLNFSCRASISSLTRWISWVWYSRIAPRICGLTNKALNLENIRNISLAFLAVPSWSRRCAVMRVSTRSIRSS